jgi:hypothetical protein
MGPEQLVFIWLTISSVSLFAMILGIIYIRNKENMAMIEKGMDPKIKPLRPLRPRPAPFRNLKWGLLSLGCGLGFFTAYVMDNFVFYHVSHFSHADGYVDTDGANVPIYFALVAIGGGLGLIMSYRIEKKELLDKKED